MPRCGLPEHGPRQIVREWRAECARVSTLRWAHGSVTSAPRHDLGCDAVGDDSPRVVNARASTARAAPSASGNVEVSLSSGQI